MKNKGFTLIEMIVTIALLGFVGIVLSMNIIKLINDQKEEKKVEVKTIIEEAACTYAILEDASYVSGTTLVSEGLIDEVINGYDIKNYSVRISIINGERKCTLVGEIE